MTELLNEVKRALDADRETTGVKVEKGIMWKMLNYIDELEQENNEWKRKWGNE